MQYIPKWYYVWTAFSTLSGPTVSEWLITKFYLDNVPDYVRRLAAQRLS